MLLAGECRDCPRALGCRARLAAGLPWRWKVCQFFAKGPIQGKAKAPASLVNKGKQGPRYVAVTVGFEPISEVKPGQGVVSKAPQVQRSLPSSSQESTGAHRHYCTKMHHGGSLVYRCPSSSVTSGEAEGPALSRPLSYAAKAATMRGGSETVSATWRTKVAPSG